MLFPHYKMNTPLMYLHKVCEINCVNIVMLLNLMVNKKQTQTDLN